MYFRYVLIEISHCFEAASSFSRYMRSVAVSIYRKTIAKSWIVSGIFWRRSYTLQEQTRQRLETKGNSDGLISR